MFIGRIGLADFWKALALLVIGCIALGCIDYLTQIFLSVVTLGGVPTAISFVFFAALESPTYLSPIIFVVVIFLIARMFVQRLHDLDQSGWMVLLIIPLLIAKFQPGKPGPNKYGPPIKHRTPWAALVG